jgi:hypothetical protein
MANGAAALHIALEPAPELPSAPSGARSTAAKPAADPASMDLERRIGEAAAGAALAVAYAMSTYAANEKAFSELVCMAVGIAEKVAHDEQVFLRARAN